MKFLLLIITALAVLSSASARQLKSQTAPPMPELQAAEDMHSEQAASHALKIYLGPLPQETETEETQERSKPEGHLIGVHRNVPSDFTGDIATRLSWTVNEDGQHIAAVTLDAEGAVSIRAQVEVDLPAGGSIQVFDGEGQARGPAYTRVDLDTPTWLPSAVGDTLTMEITLPSEIAVEALSFTIIQVAHRFESPAQQTFHCELEDVACTNSQSISDVANATAIIYFEDALGTYICSGTLLASERLNEQDPLPPYLLTANHCVSNASVASTIEAGWFYHRERCGSTAIDRRHTTTFGGADWLAGSSEQDAALLRFRHRLPGGLIYSGWSTGWSPEGFNRTATIFAVHHADGDPAYYTSGIFDRYWTGRTIGENPGFLRDALRVDWLTGVTGKGSSGAGLHAGEYLVGIHSAAYDALCDSGGSVAGSFRDFYPQIERWMSPEAVQQPTRLTHLPLLTPASWYPGTRGIVRIVNSTDNHGTVTVHAIDDTGTRFDSTDIQLGPREASQFSSADLEDIVGTGEGFWRLELSSILDIRAQAFMRFVDNNLAPMHDVIPLYNKNDDGYWYHANKFFPAKHATHVSWLRLINPTARTLRVDMVSAPDRGGDYSYFHENRSVWINLRPHASVWLSSDDLEEGVSGLRGRLGALTQGHHLFIRSSQPLWAMNLMRNPTGRFFNISTAQIPDRGQGAAPPPDPAPDPVPPPDTPETEVPRPTGFTAAVAPCGGGTFDRCRGSYKVRLQWDWNPRDHDLYRVYRGDSNRFSVASQIDSTVFSSHDDQDVVNGRTYFYWLRGENERGVLSAATPPLRVVIPSN